MTSSSTPLTPLELPEASQILLNQIISTDKNVKILHPLLDLLNTPEDRHESLVERLAFLLNALTEALRNSSSQQEQVAAQLERMTQLMEANLAAIQARQTNMQSQLTRISNMLNLPVG